MKEGGRPLSSINNNPLRVSGLASGMNTDEIVEKLVTAQSARLNKMIASKTTSTWKSDAYRDINKKLDEFRKSMESLRLQSTFSKQKVSSSDSKLEVSMAGTSTKSEIVVNSATPATLAKPAIVKFETNNAKVAEDTSFKINGIEIKLTKDMTLDQAVTEINKYTKVETAEESTFVRAANVGGSLVFTSTGTGSNKDDSKISISDVKNNTLNMSDTAEVKGSDLVPGTVTINGTTINISSNSFTYEGVVFNIKGEITSNTSIKISNDTQGIFDTIKGFVDKYNELIADLNGRLTQKKYRDFPPLTDAQKKDMKENDIKLWEEKARSGLLQNDSTVASFLNEMRNSLSTAVKNSGVSTSFDTLKDIGLNFSSNYYDKGKIEIDEAKLKGVLETNLEDVKKLFTTKDPNAPISKNTATDKTLHDESGFGFRIYDRINVAISRLGELAGSPNSKADTQSFMAKQMKALDSNISREQDKIKAYEARLWKQFSAMESALSKMNSQSSWLSQQLGM